MYWCRRYIWLTFIRSRFLSDTFTINDHPAKADIGWDPIKHVSWRYQHSSTILPSSMHSQCVGLWHGIVSSTGWHIIIIFGDLFHYDGRHNFIKLHMTKQSRSYDRIIFIMIIPVLVIWYRYTNTITVKALKKDAFSRQLNCCPRCSNYIFILDFGASYIGDVTVHRAAETQECFERTRSVTIFLIPWFLASSHHNSDSMEIVWITDICLQRVWCQLPALKKMEEIYMI